MLHSNAANNSEITWDNKCKCKIMIIQEEK